MLAGAHGISISSCLCSTASEKQSSICLDIDTNCCVFRKLSIAAAAPAYSGHIEHDVVRVFRGSLWVERGCFSLVSSRLSGQPVSRLKNKSTIIKRQNSEASVCSLKCEASLLAIEYSLEQTMPEKHNSPGISVSHEPFRCINDAGIQNQSDHNIVPVVQTKARLDIALVSSYRFTAPILAIPSMSDPL